MDCELSEAVGKAFYGNFKEMREVQRRSVMPIMAGHDVLIRSSTASGKTEGAIAPLVDRYLSQLREMPGVGVIVVSPTRALANDLYRRLEGPLSYLSLRVGIRHGERNHLALTEKPHILLTTPESFDAMVGRRDPSIQDAQAVVLDEAHLLFNTQRGLQAGISLRRLELWLKRSIQTVGLSATIGQAEQVWSFFRPGHEVIDICVTGSRPIEYRIQIGVTVPELVSLIKLFADRKILVFVNSRKECEYVADTLIEEVPSSSIFTHHSSLSTDQRQHVESEFSVRQSAICVATPTLELGVDIGSIDLVVLYGTPTNWQSLAQRVGRGNRRQEFIEALFCVPRRGGIAPDLADRLTFQALLAEAFEAGSIDVCAQDLYGAVAQQFCSELDARGEFIGINRLLEIASPWSHLDESTCIEILEVLVERGILQKHPAYRRYGPDEGLHELRESWQVWSNFPGSGQIVDVNFGERHIGQISARSVSALIPGSVFALGGSRWKVEGASWRGIKVVPTRDRTDKIVDHSGSSAQPSETVGETIRRIIVDGSFGKDIFPKRELERLNADISVIQGLLRSNKIPCFQVNGKWVYLTFAGPLLNRVIGSWAGGDTETSQMHLETKQRIDFFQLPESISELIGSSVVSKDVERSHFQNLLPEEILQREQRSIALSEMVLGEVLQRLRSSEVEEMESGADFFALLPDT